MSSMPGTVVVTGSNGGLGSRLVADLIGSGVVNLACHYRSSNDRVASVLRSGGLDPERHTFKAELSDEIEVRSLREAVTSSLGSVWAVVNLAGGSSNALSWKLSLAEFNRVLGANLVSTFLTTREFIPAMREQGKGRIINVSSVVAHTGVAGTAHYSAAKAAIEGFTRAVAQETAAKGITVNCLALGYFDDGLIRDVPPLVLDSIKSNIPVKRLGSTSELFPLVSYLLSSASSFMTGQVLHLNGGQYA
jgi:NAD(P)-dependent dehydrogenase (short-subunit alcohol dehydrogenase family)